MSFIHYIQSMAIQLDCSISKTVGYKIAITPIYSHFQGEFASQNLSNLLDLLEDEGNK